MSSRAHGCVPAPQTRRTNKNARRDAVLRTLRDAAVAVNGADPDAPHHESPAFRASTAHKDASALDRFIGTPDADTVMSAVSVVASTL